MNIWSVPERILAATHEVARGFERSTRRMHTRMQRLSGVVRNDQPDAAKPEAAREPQASTQREREYLDRVREVMAENRRLLDAVGSDVD